MDYYKMYLKFTCWYYFDYFSFQVYCLSKFRKL